MRNPDFYADREPERTAARETPAADPEYLRRVGDDWTNTWVYREDKHTLLEMLKPDFWRHGVDRGLRRGDVIELRMGAPEELKTRRICICGVNRHKQTVTLSIEGGMDGKDGRGYFKIVSFPETVPETGAAA
jgi:hypothetical protein